MKRIYSLAVLLLFALSLSAQQGKSGALEKQLFILHTSDTHSRIEPISREAADEYAGMGGAVRRAGIVKQFRSKHPDMLLLDCGDVSQGTPYYNLFQGELEIKMMNLMGYDAMAIGNHEFDFGLENMARLFRLARFPIVCSNYEVAGTVLEGLVKPYIILEREGLKIGVFGLAPKLEGLVQADKSEGVVYKDPIAVAQEMSDLLGGKEGCDVVICLSHLGLQRLMPGDVDDEQLVAKTHGIDVILGGHTHTFMEKPMVYLNANGENVSLLHSGRNGIFVGEMVLTLTKK
ncbi:bifunctional metallophosphatase/5'-nucleotidase [Bacteroides heparinolyticus]|uniref:Bifunctional metallophosphatase/5'-nucleotidase n=4 Tax=Prevotella heparinolytica TaxID=28113 RepID=A0A3P1ZYZ6_9BACE|nr:metallophosphatase [Bacteroides heparinolyticus]RRD88371.1 bifunctional metallophosphatase/5'-nucleotidase [Bacteroides heparinolyticus]VFB14414.1 metallophosphoesterase [Bacteroides heparinolyticus]